MSNQKLTKSLSSFLAEVAPAWLSILPGTYILEPALSKIISQVVSDVVNKTLSQPSEDDIARRAQLASNHLSEAAGILTDLQVELNTRNQELINLISTINARREEAEYWKTIASANEGLASKLTKEIERRVGEQIRVEFSRGKTRRQIIGVIMWLVTLIAGGIVGAVIQQWWQTGKFS